MSANAVILYKDARFVIGQENGWFYIYEQYKDKLVLVFETLNEKEAVQYVVDNSTQ